MIRQDAAVGSLWKALPRAVSWLAVTTVLTASGCAAQEGTPGPGPACAPARWTPPTPVPGLPPGVPLRSPTLTVRDRDVVVAGDTLVALDSTRFRPHPLAVVSLEGRAIGSPAGDLVFRGPQVLSDGRGGLHLLWTEPTTLPTRAREYDIGPTGRLVYSHYRGQWTAPITLAQRWDVRWTGRGTPATVGPDGRLHVLVPMADSAGTSVRHITIRGDGVHTADTSIRWAAYLAMAPGGPDDGVAFISGDPDGGANSVFFTRRGEDGRWSRPEMIQASGGDQATRIRLFRGPGGSLHMVWAQNLSGGAAPEAIRHVASRDGGRTWSTPDDVRLGPSVLDVVATLDRCGAIHVVYSHFDTGGIPRLGHVRRGDDGWGEAVPLFPDLALALEPALGLDPSGYPLLVFTSAVEGPGDGVHLAVLSSALRMP